MSASPEEALLAEIRRAARLVERGVVTAPEFIGKVYHEFANADAFQAESIRPLWESVPAAMLEEFASAIRVSATPGFQWRPLYFGPGPSEEDRIEGTQRIRAWSRAMLQYREDQSEATA